MPILKYKNPTTQLWEPVVCGSLDGSGSVDSYSKEEIDIKINELKTSVSEGKALIAAAVTDKGVSTAATDSFATMANNIKSIKSHEINDWNPYEMEEEIMLDLTGYSYYDILI